MSSEEDIGHCGHEDEEDLANPHECPYAVELHGDTTHLCTCCPGCTHECAMDI